nr:4Fe-4S dicluster domain-containing protein [Candidatus Sigynarchaeota archaeon]
MPTNYQKLIVVDPARCTGCEICEAACSFAHEGKFIALNSRIQRIRIEPITNYALSCQFCTDPPCVAVCPQKCLTKDEKTGIIQVNEQKCDGCSFCIRVCPFGAITLHTTRKKVIICDLCDSTEEKEPQCSKFCPKEAIQVKPVINLAQESRKEQILSLLKGIEKERKV